MKIFSHVSKLAILFTLVSLELKAQVTNQNLYDTLPNMVDHYRERVKMFAAEPIVTGKTIFLGNSITEGGNWQDLLGDKSFINRGIGGDVTFGVIQRLDDIITRKPSKLFILIGINDISKDFPDAVIINNYKTILQTLKTKTPSTKIYIQSLLPLNPAYKRFPQHYDKVDHVLSVNKQLQELAVHENVFFINLYPLFLDKFGRMEEKYTYDGLHLNAEGYKVWAAFLKNNKYIE
jgi:lysophospholipase L1-like esterase